MVTQTIQTTARKTASGKEALRRDSPFSYACGRCNRCCVNKIIKLNPYEVARLASNRGIATTDFIRSYTMAHGTVLNMTPQGECVFRTTQGCGVHPDRPLVCRLYPLGRHVAASGEERFSLLPPHPGSEGIVGRDGTVGQYLHAQGAVPYIDSIDKYLNLLGRMLAVLQGRGAGIPGESPSASAGSPKQADPGVMTGLAWLDMDPVVAAYCAREGLALPRDADGKMAIHIRALGTMLSVLTKGDGNEEGSEEGCRTAGS